MARLLKVPIICYLRVLLVLLDALQLLARSYLSSYEDLIILTASAGFCLLSQRLNPDISQYRDRRFVGTQEDFEKCLRESTTLYVGNLSFYTTEEQIYEVLNR